MMSLYYLMQKTRKETYRYYDNLLENRCIKVKDFNYKCRICLQEGSISIFDSDNGSEITDTLQTFADIKISENDDYPKYLCANCYKFLKAAISFRKVARQSEEILKQPVKEENQIYDDLQEHDFSDSNTCDTKPPEKWLCEEVCEVKKEKKPKIKYSLKVTCNVCNKIINRSYYKEHMTMHDPDHKKYVCDVCGKSFRLRCAYHNHSLRHRNDFPHKCQFCPYRGRYAELLKTHMRTHTGDYRYMCTECPARFLFKSNLNSHMLKHKEPEFKCDACKRAFHTKLMLRRHFEADHLGIKNHVCNICGKAFGYRNAMMKHQRHVHKREKLLFGRMPSYLAAEHRNDQEGNL